MVITFPFGHQRSRDGSFVKISSSKLIAMCEKTLAWIDEHRSHDLELAMKEERERIKNGFFHKLFRRPDPTDEEVMFNLSAATVGDAFHVPETYWINIRYFASEEVAKRLLNAARQADEVYVSTEDLDRL